MTADENWMRNAWIVAWLALLVAILWFFFGKPVWADDYPCPAGKACKVLTLTPEEQDMLLRDKGILQTAVQARPLDLGAIVQYFVTKIEHAPAGKVVEPPKPPEKKEPVAVSPLEPAEKK